MTDILRDQSIFEMNEIMGSLIDRFGKTPRYILLINQLIDQSDDWSIT